VAPVVVAILLAFVEIYREHYVLDEPQPPPVESD
jgi:hypothetical protein